MAFIVKKKIRDREYYYLNENNRVEGKVKTKTIAYLGKKKKESEQKAKKIIQELKSSRKPKEMDAFEKIQQNKKEVNVGDKTTEINKIASTRGIFFQTANIYGGKAGFYTYGHLGKALKSNWENLWRKNILSLGDNFYEIQSNNILPEEVFKASGHTENFNDPMTECKKCHFRFRTDQFLEDNGLKDAEALSIDELNDEIRKRKLKCLRCGGEVSDSKQFNMMFSVNVGFNNEKAYLSPETAQGAYITFLEEFKATRGKLPLGLAIVDKAYRNEISPRQMFFRLREFSQAELQIFFDSDKINSHEKWKDVEKEKLRLKLHNKEETEEISCRILNLKHKIPKFYLYHASKVQDFYLNVLEVPKEKFRLRELSDKERAFYNKIHFDVEVYLDTLGGFKEVGGIHYRADHDLTGHQKISGKNLEVFFEEKKILPHVLELSFGVDRNVWAMLDVFYHVGDSGSMFKFPPRLSPVKAAIFPIVKKEEYEKFSEEIFKTLNQELDITSDKSGSIGKRYARNDEIGTPFCITIDDESLRKKDVTLRNRDTKQQVRVKVSKLKETLKKLIEQKIKFEESGRIVK